MFRLFKFSLVLAAVTYFCAYFNHDRSAMQVLDSVRGQAQGEVAAWVLKQKMQAYFTQASS